VDGLLFLAAVSFGLLVVGGRLEASTPVVPAWLLGADAVAGSIGCAGLAERVALAGGGWSTGRPRRAAGAWRHGHPWPP